MIASGNHLLTQVKDNQPTLRRRLELGSMGRKPSGSATSKSKGRNRWDIQFNWIRLQDVPDILDFLAVAGLHAIQTSGNCVCNVTTDHFAGAAADEVVDPRLYAEVLRQWSTDHPELTYLPRKFKIAITGSPVDRAAVRVHDIGLLAHRNAQGETGFQVYAGGGLVKLPAQDGQASHDHAKWPWVITN